MTKLSRIEIIPQSYDEDKLHRCRGDPEPYVRWQDILFHFQNSSWRVKVTFSLMAFSHKESKYPNFLKPPIRNKLKRCQEFEAFISLISFENLPLLNNTVTQIEFEFGSTKKESTNFEFKDVFLNGSINVLGDNRFAQVAHTLRCTIREDASRVLYPSYVDDSSTSCRWMSEIQKKKKICGGVYQIQFHNDDEFYVYKEIERPFYNPTDTDIFLQELSNLKLVREVSGIVHLLAVVVSVNPYQTTIGRDVQTVIRGFVLEYYSQGTLEQALMNMTAFSWRKWPLQIAIGLFTLHQKNITHMDLKSSNIVIDDDDNAAIIDISGTGHISYEWQAPEIHQAEDPFSLPLDSRKRNDIWAYGQLLSAMAKSVNNSDEASLLIEVAADTMKNDPLLRAELPCAISKFQGFG